jgi:hypothetical protein
MKRYEVTITGTNPLLMHADSVEWADQIKAWQKDPENKKASVAGDDRSPAWSWVGALYHDGQVIAVPSDNLMTMMREGGAMVPVPGAKGNKSFKAQTQSGLLVNEAYWPLVVNGAAIPMGEIKELLNETDFTKHQETAQRLGFELFVKRARINRAKHIRVRPRFDTWQASGTISVFDDQITTEILGVILDMGGKYKGLGDWRPSSPTPGPFGTFTTEIKEV